MTTCHLLPKQCRPTELCRNEVLFDRQSCAAMKFFVDRQSCAAMKFFVDTILLTSVRRAQTLHFTQLRLILFSQSLASKPCRPKNIGSRCIASMTSTSRIAALAKEIETHTTKLDRFFSEVQMPPPSFDEDAPLMYPFPPDVTEAQEGLSAALDELWWLNQGPIQTIVAKSVCHE